MSTTNVSLRDRRQKQPSRRLVENNAAIPELSSHRESVALAQAQRALAAPVLPQPSAPLTVGSSQGQPNLDQDSGDLDLCSESAVPAPPQPTAAIESRSNSTIPPSTVSTDSSSEGPARANATTQKKKKRRLKQKWGRKTSGESDTAEMDGDGMYKVVNVMEISSSDESKPESMNKRDPTADIDQFFEPPQYSKGDKQGRRQCKACMCLVKT